MDPSSKPGLSIGEAKGLNTNSPRGVTPAPHVAQNVLLGNLGGWACAPASRQRLTGVTGALYLGRADHLLVSRIGEWGLYDGDTLRPFPGAAPDLANTVALAPGLALERATGRYIHPSYPAALNAGTLAGRGAPTFAAWDGSGSPPAGPYWRTVPSEFGQQGAGTLFLLGHPHVERGSTLSWVQRIDLPAAAAKRLVEFHNIPREWHFEVRDTYTLHADDVEATNSRGVNTWEGNALAFLQWGHAAESNRTGVLRGRMAGEDSQFVHIADMVPLGGEYFPYFVAPGVAEYHNGRIWGAGGTTYGYNLAQLPLGSVVTPAPPARLYYSEVIVDFEAQGKYAPLPEWREDNYIDVPFRVSERVVAVVSASRYLYIFGDREVFVLSGNTDEDFSLENIGDSIGAIAPQSIQKLQGVVLYLSDTGVTAIQGGQAQEVGRDVRDLAWRLNTAMLSSTVDFGRDLYSLTDGTTTLVYNVRENGWTTRSEGEAVRLFYGGGVPYALSGGTLSSLDGTGVRAMTLAWGPFDLGELLHRKQWDGVAVTVDSDGPVTVQATLTAHEANGTLTTDTASAALPAGVTPFLFSLGRDGVRVQGVMASLTLTVTPDPAARRCLLRPPVQFALKGMGEVMAGGVL